MSPTNHDSTPTRVTDPRAVAAITHPLRMRLLGELARRGSARVVDLAQVVGEPANSVSFHLRQLARYGLIEEDRDRAANRRERWWRQTSENGFQIDLQAIRSAEGGDAAAETLRRVAEGHVLALHRAVRNEGEDDPTSRNTGSSRTISTDFAVRLTDDELDQMRRELHDILDRWSEHSRKHGSNDGQARRGYYGVILAAPEHEMFRAYRDQDQDQDQRERP